MLKPSLLTFIVFLLLGAPQPVLSRFMTSAEEFAGVPGVSFSWSEARSKSIKILLEYREPEGAWRRVNLGSGFLVSSTGLFITAYHVMQHCLAPLRELSGLSVKVDCSTARPNMRYTAINGASEFQIEIISHLKEADSTAGKGRHTPDEIIKQKDFVIGQLKAAEKTDFPFWPVKEFDSRLFYGSDPRADFDLMPLMPPKRVFIAGFPSEHDFVISEGFLNLTEKNRRGYFAADLKVYSEPYLASQGVALDTKWGMRVENHMSGGAVVDAAGYVIGLVVNGNQNTAGVLSIENILSTFFSRFGRSGAEPAVLVGPAETPLYLKWDNDAAPADDEELIANLPPHAVAQRFVFPSAKDNSRIFLSARGHR